MNRYIHPSGSQNRLIALQSIAHKGAQDANNGLSYLRPDTLAQIAILAPQFATAIDTANSAKSAQATAVVAADAAVTAVSQYTRDIWAAVKRRTVRDGVPAPAQVYYGLTLQGKLPPITLQADWLNEAERMIEGEAAAVAAGYPALATVTMAQLQLRLNAARTATSQRLATKTSYRTSVAALKTLGQQADRLITMAIRELRASLGAETASARREIMRGYGARFSEATEDAPTGVPTGTSSNAPAVEEQMEQLAALATMGITQPYAVYAVNGNGTAVHV